MTQGHCHMQRDGTGARPSSGLLKGAGKEGLKWKSVLSESVSIQHTSPVFQKQYLRLFSLVCSVMWLEKVNKLDWPQLLASGDTHRVVVTWIQLDFQEQIN